MELNQNRLNDINENINFIDENTEDNLLFIAAILGNYKLTRKIYELNKELVNSINKKGYSILIAVLLSDSYNYSIFKFLVLKTEVDLNFLTKKINDNLIPVSKIMSEREKLLFKYNLDTSLNWSIFTFTCVFNLPEESLLLLKNGLRVYNQPTGQKKLPLKYISDTKKMESVISEVIKSPNKKNNLQKKKDKKEKVNFKIYDFDEFEIIESKDSEMVDGSYGETKIVKKSDQFFILKKFKLGNIKELSQDTVKEISILKFINEHYLNIVVPIYGITFDKKGSIYMVEEFLTYTLKDVALLYKNLNFDEKKIIFLTEIFYKLLYSLYKIHSYGIIHSDLKLINIMINSENNPILIDFGISEFIGYGENKDKMTSYICTHYTKAPDANENAFKIDNKSYINIYSLESKKLKKLLKLENKYYEQQLLIEESSDEDEISNTKFYIETQQKIINKIHKILKEEQLEISETIDYTVDIFSMAQIIMECIFPENLQKITYMYFNDKLYYRKEIFEYSKYSDSGIYEKYRNIYIEVDENYEDILNNYFPGLFDLICKMTSVKNRYNAKDCLKHDFFKSYMSKIDEFERNTFDFKKIEIPIENNYFKKDLNIFYSTEKYLSGYKELFYSEEINENYKNNVLENFEIDKKDFVNIFLTSEKFKIVNYNAIFNSLISLKNIMFKKNYSNNKLKKFYRSLMDFNIKLYEFYSLNLKEEEKNIKEIIIILDANIFKINPFVEKISYLCTKLTNYSIKDKKNIFNYVTKKLLFYILNCHTESFTIHEVIENIFILYFGDEFDELIKNDKIQEQLKIKFEDEIIEEKITIKDILSEKKTVKSFPLIKTTKTNGINFQDYNFEELDINDNFSLSKINEIDNNFFN